MEDQGSGNAATGGRQFPQSLEAERAVLGALILDPQRTDSIAALIKQEDFYSEAHGRTFELLVAHSNAGSTVDLLGLVQEVLDSGTPEEFGGVAYISGLPEQVPTTENVEYYARIVLDKSRRRNLLQAAGQILERGFAGGEDTADLLDFAEGRIFEVTQDDHHKNWQTLAEITDVEMPKIELRADNQGDVVGIPTGFVDLDKKLAGLQPTDLVVLAARPAMGKTALALNISQHAALTAGIGVGIFSMEMSAGQLWTRMLCTDALVEGGKVRTGDLHEKDWSLLSDASQRLYQAPVWIDDTPGLTVHQLRSRARRLKARHPELGMIVVDYLQLMQGSGGARESREQVISAISRGLKGIAKDLDVAVLALSQLNRGLESRTDKRPMPSDLRESGAIEQDADVIVFIYRDEVYNEDTIDRGVAEIIIAKQRRGPIGRVRLAWNGPFTRFDNLEERFDYSQ